MSIDISFVVYAEDEELRAIEILLNVMDQLTTEQRGRVFKYLENRVAYE